MDKSVKFANVVLGSIAVIFLIVLIYAFSRSSLHPPGSMNKYYMISVIGILFFLYALFRFDADLKVKISLLMVSFTLSIYAIEIIFSYTENVKPESIRAKLSEEAGGTYDTRHRVQVWMDLRNNGIDAYPLYSPYDNMDFKDTDLLPLGFISGKTTIFCNEGGEYIIYKADEHGFTNPKGLYNVKIDNVLIGDSFTQGACVKPEENIAGWLTKANIEVLNLGIINSGPPNELAVLKEYAKPLEPDIVFWLFYEGNDHEGLEFEKDSGIYSKYLEKDFSQNLISKQSLVDKMLLKELEKQFTNITKNVNPSKERINNNRGATFKVSLSSIKLPNLRKRLGLSDKGCYSLYNPLFKDYLAEAKRTVDGWGGNLVFVYLPSYYRYAEKIDKCKVQSHDAGKQSVIKTVKSLNIPIVDIQETFDSHLDPLSFFYFRIYGHYNSKGYKAVADQLETYLQSNRPEQAFGKSKMNSLFNKEKAEGQWIIAIIKNNLKKAKKIIAQ